MHSGLKTNFWIAALAVLVTPVVAGPAASAPQALVTAAFNGTLDCQGAQLSFSRASAATYLDAKTGKLLDAGPNVPRFETMPGRPYGSPRSARKRADREWFMVYGLWLMRITRPRTKTWPVNVVV